MFSQTVSIFIFTKSRFSISLHLSIPQSIFLDWNSKKLGSRNETFVPVTLDLKTVMVERKVKGCFSQKEGTFTFAKPGFFLKKFPLSIPKSIFLYWKSKKL